MSRIREPSTWAGVAALAQALTVLIPPHWQWVAHAITAATGTAAIKLREGG